MFAPPLWHITDDFLLQWYGSTSSLQMQIQEVTHNVDPCGTGSTSLMSTPFKFKPVYCRCWRSTSGRGRVSPVHILILTSAFYFSPLSWLFKVRNYRFLFTWVERVSEVQIRLFVFLNRSLMKRSIFFVQSENSASNSRYRCKYLRSRTVRVSMPIKLPFSLTSPPC